MSVNLGSVHAYVNDHVAELLREAENERLIQLATGPGRPVRTRVAEWLYAAAERIDGAPRGPVVIAEA